MNKERIAIVGAGLIGLDLGAALLSRGCDVVILARGARAVELKEKGFKHIDTQGHSRYFTAANLSGRIFTDPSKLGEINAAFVTVKGPSLNEAVQSIIPQLGEDGLVVTACNGILPWFPWGKPRILDLLQFAPENRARFEAFAKIIPMDRVVGGVVARAVDEVKDSPILTIQSCWNGGMELGSVTGALSPKLDALIQSLSEKGPGAQDADKNLIYYPITQTRDIHRAVLEKLAVNLYFGPAASFGLNIREMHRFHRTRQAGSGAVEDLGILSEELGLIPAGTGEDFYKRSISKIEKLVQGTGQVRHHLPSAGYDVKAGKVPEFFELAGSLLEFTAAINEERIRSERELMSTFCLSRALNTLIGGAQIETDFPQNDLNKALTWLTWNEASHSPVRGASYYPEEVAERLKPFEGGRKPSRPVEVM